MKKRRLASLFLAATLIAGGLVNSSTAAVTSKDYTEEELDSSAYDLKKYTTPYWEGNIVYNEVVYPIRAENGALYSIDLMYEATDIVSVKDYRLDVTYEDGKDYRLLNGKLMILPGSSINIVDYTYIHPYTAPSGYGEDEITPYYPHADGFGYEFWTGGSEICNKSLAVTYIHNDTWKAPVPESQEADLPNTMKKLMGKEEMTIVVAGDSVSTGAMGSGFLGISPYADAYPEMTAKALREKFGNENIKLVNSAIGGTMSHFDQTKMDNTIIKYTPDLVIINFGMNDSSCERVGIPGEEFKANLIQQIEYINEKLPECEILLVSSLYGNRYTFPAERYEEHAAVLHVLADEYEGVGVADPQAIEKYLIEETGKDFLCFMADNMVHPNDFGMRLMAQCILEALDVSDIEGYKKLLIDQMTAHADPENHIDDGKQQELIDIISKASEEITDLTKEWDINEIITKAYEDLDFVLGRCAFEDHQFKHTLIKPTCKTDGHTHSICTVCGYEYDHDVLKAIGGEHIMDSGRQSTSPTYKTDGILTYTCAKCGYEEYETVPMLEDPPQLTKSMLYVNKSYNYMQCNVQPYASGSGYVEMDVCPLNVDMGGNPYVGVWFSRYAITACYNFRTQQVEIIETNLPYAGGTPFAAKKVEWTPDSGEYDYNWKKFAVQITGNTVNIYLDGELVLSDTNELYSAINEVALVYSIGEFYFDNFKTGGSGYDPVTGTGDVKKSWDLDSSDSINSFNRDWGTAYSDARIVKANAANVTTGQYKHTHVVSYLNTVERSCSQCGYEEYVCDMCADIFRVNYKDPIYKEGHTLINPTVLEAPTELFSGRCQYKCENCYMTFIEKLPAGSGKTETITGDLNGDGILNYIDVEYMSRSLSGQDLDFSVEIMDMNGDGSVTNADVSALQRQVDLLKKGQAA